MLCERLKIQKELIPVDKVRPPVFVVKINKTQEIGSHFFFLLNKKRLNTQIFHIHKE